MEAIPITAWENKCIDIYINYISFALLQTQSNTITPLHLTKYDHCSQVLIILVNLHGVIISFQTKHLFVLYVQQNNYD